MKKQSSVYEIRNTNSEYSKRLAKKLQNKTAYATKSKWNINTYTRYKKEGTMNKIRRKTNEMALFTDRKARNITKYRDAHVSSMKKVMSNTKKTMKDKTPHMNQLIQPIHKIKKTGADSIAHLRDVYETRKQKIQRKYGKYETGKRLSDPNKWYMSNYDKKTRDFYIGPRGKSQRLRDSTLKYIYDKSNYVKRQRKQAFCDKCKKKCGPIFIKNYLKQQV